MPEAEVEDEENEVQIMWDGMAVDQTPPSSPAHPSEAAGPEATDEAIEIADARGSERSICFFSPILINFVWFILKSGV